MIASDARLLRIADEMVGGGLILVQDVEVIHHLRESNAWSIST
jgi:hypothetical protein